MDLNQLNYFRVVAEQEHITRAAKQLHISQPSLSATISRLEKELGTPLFSRSSNKIQLNENGRTFLRYVNRIQKELDRGITEIRKNQKTGLGRISYCSYGPGITDDLITRFILTHPTVSILHSLGTHDEMLAMLDNDVIDFAITSKPDRSGKYVEIPLFTDHMLILVSSTHPLSGHHTVELKDLAHERFAVFNADQTHLETTMQLCQEAGFTPDILYNGNEISLILSLVASNLCVFLCQFSNGVFGKDDPRTSNSKTMICPSECSPNMYIPVSILIRKDKELSPPVEAFVELIRQAYSTINAG